MDETFRDRIADELAAQPEPPLGDLVVNSLRQGKRLRLVWQARIAGSALAAVAVLVAGFVLGGHVFTGHGTVPGASLPQPTESQPAGTGWPLPAPVIAQPAGPKLGTTLAAIAYRVQQLVPGAQLSQLAHVQTDVRLSLQFDVDRGKGPGMIDVDIETDATLDNCVNRNGTTCLVGPHGAHTIVQTEPGNCIEPTSVSVDHGDGIVVYISVATCLPWNGTTNPPCPPALTTGEAMSIAADPSWGATMSSSLVLAANARYPALATP